ncbi:hypothetical protein Ptr902_10914 [Pyrenophora tritici-repentis]|nr:hypothetical protein Ptr902_10914 [Pyrenophora tritici-repentis]
MSPSLFAPRGLVHVPYQRLLFCDHHHRDLGHLYGLYL